MAVHTTYGHITLMFLLVCCNIFQKKGFFSPKIGGSKKNAKIRFLLTLSSVGGGEGLNGTAIKIFLRLPSWDNNVRKF